MLSRPALGTLPREPLLVFYGPVWLCGDPTGGKVRQARLVGDSLRPR